MKFGTDVHGLGPMAGLGATLDYATFWVGSWTLRYGWGDVDDHLRTTYAAGATPLIQFYYWGDDISPACVENGCSSSLHAAAKNRAGWQALAQGLADRLNAVGPGKPAVLVVESEFNKNGIERYEPFDGYLVDKVRFFESAVPAAQTVVGFGNWGHGDWATFDRAVAAADFVGVQGMRASTRNGEASYLGLADALADAATRLKATFGKPVIVTDVALSSYPEPDWLGRQEDAVGRLEARFADLRAAGVVALAYRSWTDTPTMDTANYFGEAERHWGLAWANGTVKPAGRAWLGAIAAQAPPPVVPAVSFAVSPNVNEWWVEVAVDSNAPLAKVDAVVNGKAVALEKKSWGNWAKGVHVPRGTPVSFRADVGDASPTYSWLTFPATFTLSPNVNRWWVEVHVKSGETPSRVDVFVNGKGTALVHEEWGAWAKGMNVPAGSKVQFRATDAKGWTVWSPTFTWK